MAHHAHVPHCTASPAFDPPGQADSQEALLTAAHLEQQRREQAVVHRRGDAEPAVDAPGEHAHQDLRRSQNKSTRLVVD